MKKIAFACRVMGVLLSVAVSASAQNLSGPLSGSLGPGTYTVVGDCQILTGATLTVQPGTTFLFTGNYAWNITGCLTANGTSADSIKWMPQIPDTSHEWQGLRFNSSGASGSSLQYCLIQYCDNSLTLGGGVYINGATVTIKHSDISWCRAHQGGGLYAVGSALTVEDCKITHNSSVEAIIESGNGGGMFLLNCNNAYIRRTELAWNHNSGA